MVRRFVRLNERREHLDVIAFGGPWLRVPNALDLFESSAVVGVISDRTDFHCQEVDDRAKSGQGDFLGCRFGVDSPANCRKPRNQPVLPGLAIWGLPRRGL